MTDLSPLWLSLRVALVATMIVLPPGLLLAWWLSRGKPSLLKAIVDTVATLPLVLPPTVVGFALLMALGRGTAFGRWLNESVGLELLFTWQGAAVAASVMAFPLFVRSASAAFATVDEDLLAASRTLGATEGMLLRHVIVPLSYRGLLAGLAMAFARALGEFGATLMVAGSIPGRTQTLPVALYARVQAGDNEAALFYTACLSLIALMIVAAVGLYQWRVGVRR